MSDLVEKLRFAAEQARAEYVVPDRSERIEEAAAKHIEEPEKWISDWVATGENACDDDMQKPVWEHYAGWLPYDEMPPAVVELLGGHPGTSADREIPDSNEGAA